MKDYKPAYRLRVGDVLEDGREVSHIDDHLSTLIISYTDGTSQEVVYCYMFYLQKGETKK